MSERKSPRERITEIATFLYEEHMKESKTSELPKWAQYAIEAKSGEWPSNYKDFAEFGVRLVLDRLAATAEKDLRESSMSRWQDDFNDGRASVRKEVIE